MKGMTEPEILSRAVSGERRWLARAITLLELRRPALGAALSTAAVRRRQQPGAPHVVGVTGPPGAGKSTFVDQFVSCARARGERVAVVAVDPSSPFSGGAILGDRIRMEQHTADDGVYIRSLSSRGNLGGLSGATADVVDLLDAAGFDTVVVETVGVGQSELGVMEVADTCVVVLTPESGDTVQAMKAGLMEIADLFVVNKADRPGAAALVRALERSLALVDAPADAWPIPVFEAVATEGRGVVEVERIARQHLAWCTGPGGDTWKRRRGDLRVRRVLDLVAEEARAAAQQRLAPIEDLVRSGQIDPHSAMRRLT